MIKLDIVSDPVCPWCYIGKANLDRALEASPGHGFDIEWHPFQLNPDMPRDGMDRAAYLEAKFGRERAVAAYARVDQAAKAAGLAIDWAAIRRVPNTVDAHRVIHWAGIEGRQDAVVTALFGAYWQEGRDIGDAAVLTAIAGEAGLDAAMIAELLKGGADADHIRARDEYVRVRGVDAVPTFIVANRHVVQGAQPSELWLRVIDELAGAAERREDA